MSITAIAGANIPSDTANSIQVMKVCQALAEYGHAINLIIPGKTPYNLTASDTRWNELLTVYGLRTSFDLEYLTAPGPLGRRIFTWQAVRRALVLETDLIYTWFPQSAVFGLLARKPVILEIHEPPSGRVGPLWYKLFIHIPGRKRLLSITRALIQVLDQKYGAALHTDEIVIGPNGVDIERFRSLPDSETARRQLGLIQAPTVLCTGHLYPGRGADLFLALAKSTPSAQFVWVGGRPQDVTEWRERATGLANVQFTGFVPNKDIPLYQAAGDVLLMPYGRVISGSSGGNSAEICSPMKMFEYMASGRTILTSDLPVIREVLNESMAVFCPPEDVTSWQSALHTLLADPSRREALGKSSRRNAENYSWQARARRTLEGFI